MKKIGEPVFDEKFKRHYQEVVFSEGDEIPEGSQCMPCGEWVNSPWRIPCDPPVTATPQRKLYAVGYFDGGRTCVLSSYCSDTPKGAADEMFKVMNDDEDDNTYFVAELNIIGTAQRQVVKTGVLAEGKGE